MSEKLIGFRRTEEFKKTAEIVAKNYNLTAGALAGFLLEKFITAYEEHGTSLKFPPKFDYNEELSMVEAKDKRDALAKAG